MFYIKYRFIAATQPVTEQPTSPAKSTDDWSICSDKNEIEVKVTSALFHDRNFRRCHQTSQKRNPTPVPLSHRRRTKRKKATGSIGTNNRIPLFLKLISGIFFHFPFLTLTSFSIFPIFSLSLLMGNPTRV